MENSQYTKVSCGDMINRLVSKNYMSVTFPLSHKHFCLAAESFLDFLTLPDDVKNSFYHKIDPRDRGSAVGYVLKARHKGDLDNKEYFHYHPIAEEEFLSSLANPDPRIHVFFGYARTIHYLASLCLSEILRELEGRFPGLRTQFFPEKGHPHFYLRFLKYATSTTGDFLAAGHYDRGGCTLALSESAPGLRIGKDDRSLEEVVHTDKTALFFPAVHFDAMTSPELRPAWHDVIQKQEDRYSDSVARWAVVFFADAVEFAGRTKLEEAHTPKR